MHPEFDFVFVDSGYVPAFWFVPPPGLFLLFVSPFPLSVLGLDFLGVVSLPDFGFLSNLGHWGFPPGSGCLVPWLVDLGFDPRHFSCYRTCKLSVRCVLPDYSKEVGSRPFLNRYSGRFCYWGPCFGYSPCFALLVFFCGTLLPSGPVCCKNHKYRSLLDIYLLRGLVFHIGDMCYLPFFYVFHCCGFC